MIANMKTHVSSTIATRIMVINNHMVKNQYMLVRILITTTMIKQYLNYVTAVARAEKTIPRDDLEDDKDDEDDYYFIHPDRSQEQPQTISIAASLFLLRDLV